MKNLVLPKSIKKRTKKVALVILRSIDGEKDWDPVKPEDVPEFVKQPDVIRRLIKSDMVQDASDPYWYRGEQQVIH